MIKQHARDFGARQAGVYVFLIEDKLDQLLDMMDVVQPARTFGLWLPNRPMPENIVLCPGTGWNLHDDDLPRLSTWIRQLPAFWRALGTRLAHRSTSWGIKGLVLAGLAATINPALLVEAMHRNTWSTQEAFTWL